MKDYRDIWNAGEGSKGLTEEQLLAYLEGRLPELEQRALEELLCSEGIESDALEGLKALGGTEAKKARNALNTALWKRVGRSRHKRRGIGSQQWSLIAIAIVLLLAIACFLVFWMMRR